MAYLRIRKRLRCFQSTILQTVKLPILQNDKCEKAFKNHAKIGAKQVCVGRQVGRDSCGRDSGGL